MITGIAHTAIRVMDLDRALGFYRDGLGFEEAFRLQRDGKVWIVYLRVGSDQFLELFPDAQPGPDLGNTVGYAHLCLAVDDIHATAEELASRGVDLDGEPRLGQDGSWQVWTADPDGTRIELMQLTAQSLQAGDGK